MAAILITGCSSGYGLETARYFLERGRDVIATMREPREDLLPASPRLRLLQLDVTDEASIARAVEAAGPVEALVNNAGVGAAGAFEAMSMADIRAIFETNTFGVMAMAKAFIPQMRERRSGVIVNVTSSATLAPMPLVSVYTASKQAIEGFSGSLAHELGHFGVRVKLVEPGHAPTTRFAANSPVSVAELVPPAYSEFAGEVFAAYAGPALTTSEADVAHAVWAAVDDVDGRLRFPAGADAVALSRAA